MEQPSIFSEGFEQAFLPRRRQLMPGFLKVYCWIGMVLGALMLLLILVLTGAFFVLHDENFLEPGLQLLIIPFVSVGDFISDDGLAVV